MWYAHVTLNRDYPPRPRPGVLHLSGLPAQGRGDTDVTDPAAFAAFVAAHPEIGTVLVYDSRFPQRPVPWAKFVDRHAGKIWDLNALEAAFSEASRRRMADPNYVPTLAEALRHPDEFVEGMRQK